VILRNLVPFRLANKTPFKPIASTAARIFFSILIEFSFREMYKNATSSIG
jgi:hypothetical protein